MQLLNQIIELDCELGAVLLGEGNTLAVNKFASIDKNITPSLKELVLSFNCRKLYKSLPGDYSIKIQNEEEIELSQSALRSVEEFILTWDELEQKHVISQDDICSNVRDSVKRISRELEARNTRQYNEWVSQISTEVDVTQADLEQQENSPNLQKNALEYCNRYQRFCNEIDTDYPTEKTISNLVSLSKQLLELKDKMEFDQPEGVVRLFKHLKQIGTNGRAPIAMLTPQVLEWMADKGQ